LGLLWYSCGANGNTDFLDCRFRENDTSDLDYRFRGMTPKGLDSRLSENDT